MALTIRDIMHAGAETVEPDMSLTELERAFIERKLGGFPVVENGRMIGIVSRLDIIRQLCVERSRAEMAADFYAGAVGQDDEPLEDLHDIAERVGKRIEHLQVADVMIHDVLSVRPDDSLAEVAGLLIDKHIHRVPVVEDDRLVGMVSSLDFVRLFAEGKARPS